MRTSRGTARGRLPLLANLSALPRSGGAGLGVVVLAVMAAVLSGCAGSGAAAPVVDVPAGVSVSVLQYRSDQAVRRIQMKVTNDGKAPITVIGASLTTPGFEGSSAWASKGGADDAVIGPGEATDLPAPLPTRFTCGNPVGQALVRLTLAGHGTTRPTTVTDTYGVLRGVHDQDCLEKSATDVAKIELVEPLRTAGRKTFLDLRFTPTGAPGTLTIESVRSTTLLDPPAGDAWPVKKVVRASSGVVTASLELQPARCDPHAIAEDKLGTVMGVTLHVDDGASGEVDFPADTALKNEIQNWVLKTCGF